MYTFFYLNISGFDGNLQGILDEGTYKTSIQNMHNIYWKKNCFKSSGVSMFGRYCGVSQYPHFYDKIQKKYQLLPRLYVGSYPGEKGHNILQEKLILTLAQSVETFVTVSISDMLTINIGRIWGKLWIMQNIIFLNKAGLVKHLLRHWKILEVIYS